MKDCHKQKRRKRTWKLINDNDFSCHIPYKTVTQVSINSIKNIKQQKKSTAQDNRANLHVYNGNLNSSSTQRCLKSTAIASQSQSLVGRGSM